MKGGGAEQFLRKGDSLLASLDGGLSSPTSADQQSTQRTPHSNELERHPTPLILLDDTPPGQSITPKQRRVPDHQEGQNKEETRDNTKRPMDGLRSANPPSAAVLGERRYPVVFAEPTLAQVCESWRKSGSGTLWGCPPARRAFSLCARAPLRWSRARDNDDDRPQPLTPRSTTHQHKTEQQLPTLAGTSRRASPACRSPARRSAITSVR